MSLRLNKILGFILNITLKKHGGGEGRRNDKEFGISRCKLLSTEWLNKVPPYSTGNYIQYPIINHNGKKIGIKYIQRKKG